MPILRRVGRPGLLGTVARTAVVAGTATAVTGAVAQRQQNRAVEHQMAQQQALQQQVPRPQFAPEVAAPPAAPIPAPAAGGVDLVATLAQLGELHSQGLLSVQEFTLAKQQLLGT